MSSKKVIFIFLFLNQSVLIPKSVFLQYIERGVFSLNVGFVESIFQELSDSEDDKLFKYELLSHLNKRDKSLEIMQDHVEYAEYPFYFIYLFILS